MNIMTTTPITIIGQTEFLISVVGIGCAVNLNLAQILEDTMAMDIMVMVIQIAVTEIVVQLTVEQVSYDV